MKAYREHTGNFDAMPRINAGGTYLRFLPSCIDTGTTTKHCTTPLPCGHGAAHQRDECINLEGFLEGLEIIIKMLIECDKTDN
jgi:acetylornithine deacetylase/succinyl-diaminopimelate desuccinylase-like protein